MTRATANTQGDVQLSSLDLHHFIKSKDEMSFRTRCRVFDDFIQRLKEEHKHSYYHTIASPVGPRVVALDPVTSEPKEMIMFASNNYLGLADHPYVKARLKSSLEEYGVGIGGPPLLNGYSFLMRRVEERLADLKGQEAALVFSAGFLANLGLICALTSANDTIIYDAHSHASAYDAIKLTEATSVRFEHNDMADLEEKLRQTNPSNGTTFVAIEGVYSMDGDLAPLDIVLDLCKKYNAISLLDDAHGTGVLGARGSGTAEHFGLEDHVDISMGTFSKTFAVTGGFVCGPRDIINYLRYFARSYMFSAALPPVTLAAVDAGLDVIEQEPERRQRLLENAAFAHEVLAPFGFYADPQAAILALRIPRDIDIRKAGFALRQKGFFVNAIEYPAVSLETSRFRISMMSDHSREDIQQLAAAIEEVFSDDRCKEDST